MPWRPWPRWTSRRRTCKLRKLMDEPDIEVRYGAFNALRTLDPTDAYLGRVRVLNDPKPDEDEDRPADSMAMEIATVRGAATAPKTPSPCTSSTREGPPLVHVSRTRRTEIVDLRPAAEAADPRSCWTAARS